MTEDFATDALAYVLGDLDGPSRARFEACLASDPAAAAELKSLADSLADFAVSAAPEQPLSAQERGETIVAVMNEVGLGAARRGRGWTSAYFWPAAAAILLFLNLGQWWLHSRVPAASHLAGAPVGAPPGIDRAQAHFASLARRDTGLRPAPPPNLSAPTVAPAGAVAFGVTLTFSTVISAAVTQGPAIATVSFSQATLAPPAASAPVYGWSAFDPQRHQGSIDLHNLPNVPDGQSLQLWVRMVGSTRFTRVGEIPSQIYGRSGSIAFCLPSLTDTPAQIRITLEPRRSAPLQPTGVEVLRVP